MHTYFAAHAQNLERQKVIILLNNTPKTIMLSPRTAIVQTVQMGIFPTGWLEYLLFVLHW